MDINSNIKDLLLSVPETADAPSAAVWEGVQRGLKRKDFWRIKGKLLLCAGVLAVAGGFSLLLIPEKNISGKILPPAEITVETTEENMAPAKAAEAIAQTTEEKCKNIQAAVSVVIPAQPVEVRSEALETPAETHSQPVYGEIEAAVSEQTEEKQASESRTALASPSAAKPMENVNTSTEKTQQKTKTSAAFHIIFPSAFTPNGDGLNDTYSPLIPEPTTQYVMRIYNRKNQLVFQTLHPEESWDGTFRGQVQPHGAYICIVSCMTASGKHSSKGEFLLLRD